MQIKRRGVIDTVDSSSAMSVNKKYAGKHCFTGATKIKFLKVGYLSLYFLHRGFNDTVEKKIFELSIRISPRIESHIGNVNQGTRWVSLARTNEGKNLVTMSL